MAYEGWPLASVTWFWMTSNSSLLTGSTNIYRRPNLFPKCRPRRSKTCRRFCKCPDGKFCANSRNSITDLVVSPIRRDVDVMAHLPPIRSTNQEALGIQWRRGFYAKIGRSAQRLADSVWRWNSAATLILASWWPRVVYAEGFCTCARYSPMSRRRPHDLVPP